MNRKFIVKIEQGNLEQTFKVAEADLTEEVNSVFELLDEEFLKTVSARFTEMRKDFKEAYGRYNYWFVELHKLLTINILSIYFVEFQIKFG